MHTMAGRMHTRIVDLRGRGSFRVHSGGSPHAPGVVLLHGLGASADLNWSATMAALHRNYRVVAPDIRGHGATRTTDRFTLEDAADDVVALADSLSLGTFTIVGYSMGGAIAQLAHLRHRERVRGVVLCATSRSFRSTLRERAVFAALPPARLAARVLPGEVSQAMARHAAARLVDDACDALMDQSRTFDIGHTLEAAAALGHFDSRHWVGRIDVPAAVVVHLRDQLVPTNQQFALARALPDATVHPFDGDHLGVVKKPQSFIATLQAALCSVDRRTGVPARRAGSSAERRPRCTNSRLTEAKRPRSGASLTA
jgi:pimeloyl-ACP methyl ester carboxylesterase